MFSNRDAWTIRAMIRKKCVSQEKELDHGKLHPHKRARHSCACCDAYHIRSIAFSSYPRQSEVDVPRIASNKSEAIQGIICIGENE